MPARDTESPETLTSLGSGLQADMTNKLAAYQVSTLKWVLGIVIAAVIGLVTVVLTGNRWLRQDVNSMRLEIRDDLSVVNRTIEDNARRIDSLRQVVSGSARNNR